MAKWEHCSNRRNRQENSELCGGCEKEGEGEEEGSGGGEREDTWVWEWTIQRAMSREI